MTDKELYLTMMPSISKLGMTGQVVMPQQPPNTFYAIGIQLDLTFSEEVAMLEGRGLGCNNPSSLHELPTCLDLMGALACKKPSQVDQLIECFTSYDRLWQPTYPLCRGQSQEMLEVPIQGQL